MEQIKTRAQKIKLVIFDVDGVLTDGRLFYGDDGQEYKAFQSRDGHGMKMLQKSGVEIALITGRTSEVVNHRAKNLGIHHIYQGQLQKLPAFNALLERLKFTADEVAYVGDDVVDLPVERFPQTAAARLLVVVQDDVLVELLQLHQANTFLTVASPRISVSSLP